MNMSITPMARAVIEASRKRNETPYDKLYNALDGSEPDLPFVAAAANSPELLKALQPVELEPELYKDYNSFFYNRKRAFLIELFDQVADVTNSFNVFFMFMRDLLVNGRTIFAAESNAPEWEKQIQASAKRAVAIRDQMRAGNPSSLTRSMQQLLASMMTGNKHSLRRSQIYSGGIDVILAQSAQDKALMCCGIPYGNHIEGSSRSIDYAANRSASYLTDTSLKVKKAAGEILDLVFGGGTGSREGASASIMALLPLTFDFSEIQRIFERNVGVNLNVEFFHNVTFGADGKSKALQFCRVVLALEAEKTAGAALNNLFKLQDRQSRGEEAADLLNSATKFRKQVADDTTEEAALLNRQAGGTIAFTFDGPTARFIAQAEPNEELNISNFDNWFALWSSQFLRKKGSKVQNAITQGRIKLANIPRYVLPVSKIANVTETRKRLNMSVEQTRANEDGLYVTPSGCLAYLPTADDRSKLTVVTEFERLANSVANTCSNYGISPGILSNDYADLVSYGIPYEDYVQAFTDLKKLRQMDNSLLSYDWDYGLRIYASERPGIVRCDVQIGAVTPDALTLADYLGFNLAKPGQAPMQKSFIDSLLLMTHENPVTSGLDPRKIYGDKMNPDGFVESALFKDIFETYYFHAYKGELPKLEEMVKTAFNELSISLPLNAETPRDQWTMYSGVIMTDGTLTDKNRSYASDIATTKNLLSRTVQGVGGGYGSYVNRTVREDIGRDADNDAYEDALSENEDYFAVDSSPASHFVRLYNFIGGHVLKQIFDGLNSLTVEQLTSSDTQLEYSVFRNRGVGIAPHEEKKVAYRPDTQRILNAVKPVALVFGKYAQNYEVYEQQAQEEIDSIGRDAGIDASDIKIPGSSPNLAMFPHQVDTHRYLRKQKPPKFAVFDISPGGGKTLLGLTDIAALAGEMQTLGKRIKPLVLCPDGLIRNWCDDMKAFTGGNWNMIPIDNNIFKRWGAEKLQRLIAEAPPNTIVVAGLNFLRNNSMSVVIGNAVVNVSGNLEFIKALQFNYVIIDESHRLKGFKTSKHKIAKQLTTASFIDYLRIATGTLIADRVRDIEGQTSLYSPHIFRQGELDNRTVSQALDEELKLGDESVDLWKVNTPQRARERLGKFAAVVTKKKKEWAFMLPSPIEKFYAVQFTPGVNDAGSEEDINNGNLHRELYDAVVAESIQEIQELIRKGKGKSKSDDDDDDDDDEPEVEAAEGEDAPQDLEMEEGDELAGLDIDVYLQRIERLIVAPEKDPLFPQVFGAYGITNYTSRKARKVAQIVTDHFKPEKWEKGKQYTEYDLVDFNGSLYLARKRDLSSPKRALLDRDTIGKTPDTNPELWKKEPPGKVIVFCRYTNSVDAIYDALPPHIQKMTVKFTGAVTDKWANLEAFKTDPKVQVIVANEQGLSEGHNLQMASRLVRVESPWGPGELDQSASRVFRPDPKGAAAGEIYREAVFLDWVLGDNTMEVAKQGRLIAKIFNKVRFDEAENPAYAQVLGAHLLEEVSMSLDVLQERPSLQDYAEYVQAYAALNALQANEFHEMRTTQLAEMLPIEETPALSGSRIIETPFVSAQNIVDRNGWKPIDLKQFLRLEKNRPFAEDPKSLIGTPVLTDVGNGMIVNVSVRMKADPTGVDVVDVARPIVNVLVKMRGDNSVQLFKDTGIVYMLQNLSAKDKQQYFAVDLAYRKADLARQAALIADQERLEEQERKEAVKRERREAREAKVRVTAKEAGDKRIRNIREGKPINEGVKYDPNAKGATGFTRQKAESAPDIQLSPANYHGYLTLETDNLDLAPQLKKLKFKEFGEYVYVTITRKGQMHAILDYLEDNFTLSDKTMDRLEDIQDAFEQGGKRALYRLELAPISQLPSFFATRKQLVKDRKEVRVYPLFMHDQLMLAIDLATCPIIKRHIGKPIAGAGTKWQLSPGALMYFATNKTDLKAKIKEVAAAFNVTNRADVDKEVAQFTPTRKK